MINKTIKTVYGREDFLVLSPRNYEGHSIAISERNNLNHIHVVDGLYILLDGKNGVVPHSIPMTCEDLLYLIQWANKKIKNAVEGK